MSKFVHYQFNEDGECVTVSYLSKVVNAESVVFEAEAKKLSKEEKAAAREKLGKKKKAKLKNNKVDWDAV